MVKVVGDNSVDNECGPLNILCGLHEIICGRGFFKNFIPFKESGIPLSEGFFEDTIAEMIS